MSKLYFFDSSLDYVLSGISYGRGFKTCDVVKEDSDYFYYNNFHSENRLCKKTYIEECKNFYTGLFEKEQDVKTFYLTKELWEKAKSEYFAKILSDSEEDKQKILKSMIEGTL